MKNKRSLLCILLAAVVVASHVLPVLAEEAAPKAEAAKGDDSMKKEDESMKKDDGMAHEDGAMKEGEHDHHDM